MIILGIDPGTVRVGYGLIKKERATLRFVAAGLLKIKSTAKKNNLLEIKKTLDSLLRKHQPEIMAVEKLYFAQNQKTAMAVARAAGVIILAGLEAGLKIEEYSPSEIKAGLTGYGLADKAAVAKMVKLSLRLPKLKVIDDVSDALAIAVLAARQSGLGQG